MSEPTLYIPASSEGDSNYKRTTIGFKIDKMDSAVKLKTFDEKDVPTNE
jgi:hypothetical protein